MTPALSKYIILLKFRASRTVLYLEVYSNSMIKFQLIVTFYVFGARRDTICWDSSKVKKIVEIWIFYDAMVELVVH